MIGIIGGGISGLALGLALRDRGMEAVVLEASERPGGVIRSGRVEERVLDFGPQRTRRSSEVDGLIRRVGLEDRVLTAPSDLSIFVYRAGALHPVPFTPRELLRSSLLSPKGRARVLLEPLTSGMQDGESVGAYFRRKLGREAYEALVGPLFGGLYASDPDNMLGHHALDEILRALGVKRSLLLRALRGAARRAGAIPAVSFMEGMEELPRAVALALGEAFRSSVDVLRVEPRRGGWRIVGDGEMWEVERVVITVPAPAAALILEGVLPEVAGRLRNLRYNPLAMVHLVAEEEEAPRGWGYQVAFGEELRTRGVTWNDAIFQREGIHTAFLGGARDPEAVGMDDTRLGEVARKEFLEVTGLPSRTLSVSRTRIPAWDRTWQALDDLPELPRGLHLFANWESRVGLPARVRRAEALAQELAGEAAVSRAGALRQ